MARTYIPGLRKIAQLVRRYFTRWQTKLEESLSPAQYTCAVALSDAALECLIALGEEAINP